MAELYSRPGSVGKWTSSPKTLEIIQGQTAEVILWGGGERADEPLELAYHGNAGMQIVEDRKATGTDGTWTVTGNVPSTGKKYTGPLKLVVKPRKASSTVIEFDKLWNGQPRLSEKPCQSNGKPTYENQCAIRLGIGLAAAGVNMNVYRGSVCGLAGHKIHARGAQQLANWLSETPQLGAPTKFKPGSGVVGAIDGLKGIVFCRDFYGEADNPTGDHIDSWNGSEIRAGSSGYFAPAKEVWFWQIKT
jgi:hypothetical protein